MAPQESERYFHELVGKAQFDPTLRPNTVTYAALISGGVGAVDGAASLPRKTAGALAVLMLCWPRPALT